jgi:hypothetical protein
VVTLQGEFGGTLLDAVRGLIGIANVGETPVKPGSELIRVEILLGAAPASNHHARSGHSRQSRETDEFPGHPHRCVAYGS